VKSDDDGTLRGLKIRGYRRRDRAEVLQIAAASFDGVSLDENIQQHFGRIGHEWRQLKQQAVDYDLGGNPTSVLVAELDGRIVAFACNRLYRQRRIGHVANLAVAPPLQGKGIGKLLLEASMQHFRDTGMRYVRIETLAQNEKADRFYRSIGFQEVGRQVYFFKEL